MRIPLFLIVSCVFAGSFAAASAIRNEIGERAAKNAPVERGGAAKSASESSANTKSAKAKRVGLTEYHSTAVRNFAMTPGFGLARMPTFHLRVKDKVVHFSPGDFEQVSPLVNRPELRKADSQFRSYFVNGKDILDRRLTGFLTLPPEKTDAKGKRRNAYWRISSIDLVGLNDLDAPVVYDSIKVYMKKYPNARRPKRKSPSPHDKEPALGIDGKPLPKTARAPDFFELAGVEYLRKGKSLFVAKKDNTMRMLGALRATNRCAKCHAVKNGTLLGALSYTLVTRKR